MSYKFDHVHLKAQDPKKSADWFVKAFDFTVISDATRPWGDRFIRCEAPNGTVVNISGARTNEKMGDGDASAHWGLEHIGISVDDMEPEIERLSKLGAKLMEGPVQVPGGGPIIAFIEGPDRVRIELLQMPA